jgi:hypothetical protein
LGSDFLPILSDNNRRWEDDEMTTRGFGVAGVLDRTIVAALASDAEQAGYATFWANDTETGDGLDAIRAALATTSSIRFGVGVIPIDRVPAEEIAARVKWYGLPEDRLTIGIGSGGLTQGALDAVRTAAEELARLTTARIVIGALGPKMVALSGESSAGALLNWLTPEFAAKLAVACRESNPGAWVAAYVRVGLTGRGAELVVHEGAKYAGFPAYGASFKRMGVNPEATSAYGEPAEIQNKLAQFDASGIDETVVRAIAAAETLDAYRDVLKAAAPHG